MSHTFDSAKAKKNLTEKETRKREDLEVERQKVMARSIALLQGYFKGKDVEVILVGSLTQPGKFTQQSDVDIVLKNFQGNRFDIWPDLERRIDRKIEIILYENCSFKDHVDQFGYRVI